MSAQDDVRGFLDSPEQRLRRLVEDLAKVGSELQHLAAVLGHLPRPVEDAEVKAEVAAIRTDLDALAGRLRAIVEAKTPEGGFPTDAPRGGWGA